MTLFDAMLSWWRWSHAFFHCDDYWVCELSRGRGLHDDYHTYRDSVYPYPWHIVEHRCKRCRKRFIIG